MESPPGPEVMLGGRRLLYFGGTGYHCLQGHPALVKAAHDAMKQYGMGTGTGRTMPVGRSPVQEKLEKKAAQFLGTEDAVCIPSGYMSNSVGLAGLAGCFDRCFVDEISHYSIADAVKLTEKPVESFAHRDGDDLRKQLRNKLKGDEVPLLISDGVFPTFGELAPVDEYLEVLEPYGGLLWLDDAHAVGVLGPEGRGTIDYYGLSGNNLFFCGSLAKAVGAHGGVVPGSRSFCRRIRECCGFIRGSSAISIPAAAAATAGLTFLIDNPQWRKDLAENARFVKRGICEMGISIRETPHPVIAFSLGNGETHRNVQLRLLERGISIQHSHYIGAGESGVLRIVVFSQHTRRQLERLLHSLREVLKETDGCSP